MLTITPSPKFHELCPDFRGIAITANVVNSETDKGLWEELNAFAKDFEQTHTTESIKEISGIVATRAAYKAAGKDPSRYRPSNEQLARRIVQGKGLYAVNTIVDLGNLVSLKSNYSVGAIDLDKVEGEQITLDFGQADEPYEGIGRGPLNIEHLPVYRDGKGGFATPTSDSTRTMLSLSTNRLLLIINAYDGNSETMEQAKEESIRLLTTYASAKNFAFFTF